MRDVFLFDLDNTLYTPERGILTTIDLRIRQFMKVNYGFESDDKINYVRKKYYETYGSTMLGLMKNYGLDPICYLEYIHNIDDKLLPPFDEKLNQILSKIDGTIILLTNSYEKYALKVLMNLGISEHFDYIYDVVDMNYLNKKHLNMYQRFLRAFNFKAENCIMHDDVWDFLRIPQLLGMTTVLVNMKKSEGEPDFHIQNIYELPLILDELRNSS